MSSKYGLHKKIAFIFEGGPGSQEPMNGGETVSQAAAPAGDLSNTYQPAPAGAHAPASLPADGPSVTQRPAVKKKKSGRDPRQTRMAILAAALVPVFCGVLMLTLKSPKPSKAAAKKDDSAPVLTTSSKTPGVTVTWSRPEPWPQSVRDPMQIGRSPQAQNLDPLNAGGLVIKGIVHSETRSSAIIADQIVFEGDRIQGALVSKISKDSVEFQRDGKTWTQQVER